MPSKEGRNPTHEQIPSFSSTLLDKIYGSVADDGRGRGRGSRVMRVAASDPKMQHGCSEGAMPSCFIKKCRGNRGVDSQAQGTGVCSFREVERRLWDFDVDRDVAYFSSTSISSDSSSGGFSSSDTESFHGGQTKASCFAPLKLKPVKTHSALSKTEKPERGDGSAPFPGNREEGVEPKSKAWKAYETLKKVRQQPVSPGGRLTSLLSSIFTPLNKKKGRSLDDASLERKPKSGQASTCSSAASFSRACLNNSQCPRSTAVSLKDKPKDVAGTRSARFCPVNVIDIEHRPRGPCGGTFQHDEAEGGKDLRSVGFLAGKTSWRTRMQEIRRLEDIKRTNEKIQKGADRAQFCSNDDDDDGAGSCSSSDLFEIDHLAMTDSDLPV